jgi:hypothetical protein
MQFIVRLSLIVLTPYLLLVYWRNSMREMDNLHAQYELNYE